MRFCEIQIHGFEAYYKISNNGVITSLGRIDRIGRPFPEKILKPHSQKSGHLIVTLFKNEKRYRFLVSRLVAIHFIPNPHNYPCVRHKDDNPKNNHVDNLCWGTYKDNSQDMVSRNRQAKGEKNGMYGMSGNLSPSSIPVLDTQTGIFYDSISEAANAKCVGKSYLSAMLSGNRRNKTSFIYA